MKNRVFQKVLLPPLPTLMMEASLSLKLLLYARRVELQYGVVISQINTSS
jgi:hypothetical protein